VMFGSFTLLMTRARSNSKYSAAVIWWGFCCGAGFEAGCVWRFSGGMPDSVQDGEKGFLRYLRRGRYRTLVLFCRASTLVLAGDWGEGKGRVKSEHVQYEKNRREHQRGLRSKEFAGRY
jgi:hypothetical protein